MTNEELIQDMKDHIARREYEGYALTNEECEQVIQALEQQRNITNEELFALQLNAMPSVTLQPKTIQEKQAESEKYQKAFDDGYENGYAQARFDYEQQPCEDCISREEVHDAFVEWYLDLLEDNDVKDFETILLELPSVQPQPKRGKWEVIRKEYEFMGGVVNEVQGCKCSNCGGIVKFKSDFCPNCGADMREVQDDDRI